MAILSFLTHVLGATMLLLYAVRMVRTGIERAFGSSFRKVLTVAETPGRASLAGLFLALILQSSASVALLVAGFSSIGAIAFPVGLAAVLGADLGAALLIEVLSFQLSWLEPVLLAIGGGLFLNANRRAMKQAGRIVLGFAFILIALSFLRAGLDPIQSSAYLPVLVDFLDGQPFAAFMLGAAMAFIMRSGVAAILMFVAFVASGAAPVGVGLSLVLGANLGGAALPLWSTRGMPAVARRAPAANFALRGVGALLALMVIDQWSLQPHFGWTTPAQAIVLIHILFNFLLLGFLPLCGRLEPLLVRLMPEAPMAHFEPGEGRVNDEREQEAPIALIMLKREVMRAARLAQAMVAPALLLAEGEEGRAAELLRQRETLSAALSDIRRAAAALARRGLTAEGASRVRDLSAYADALGAGADILVNRLAGLRGARGALWEEGRAERAAAHEKLLANMALAVNVLASGDPEHAQLLLEEKTEMARREQASRKRRQKRHKGEAGFAPESDAHLETLRALTDINSEITAISGLVLRSGGQLLESRLIGDLKN